MPLEDAVELLTRARSGGYALGYFESWNFESLQGVIDAAETTKSPVVIGFNGEFLSHQGRLAQEDIAWYGALGRAAAEAARVPCAFIFNECASDVALRRAVHCGFNMAMPSDTSKEPLEYRAWVAAYTQYAHAHGVAVEAEIGELPCGAEGERVTGGTLTEPREAAEFVSHTGVDFLAVSVGNIHIMVHGQQGLNVERLDEIRKCVSIPLVLHGGSGIEPMALRNAIELGVAKVNFGTYLKQRYLTAVRAALECKEHDPHKLLGMGGKEDVLVAGRMAVCEAAMERMELLGCRGRG